MVRVKVYRISSTTDPDTNRPGKMIELVETRKATSPPVIPGEEARAVQGVVMQLRSMGVFPWARERVVPKLTLFLTEQEYMLLNLRLEVNEVYDLKFKDGAIHFEVASE
ncbi:MAG: arcadin 1 [Nitrososphaeria archaeon]